MGKISLYSNDSSISLNDLLIGTDKDNNDVTRNYPIGSVLALVPDVEWGDIVGTLSDQTDLQNALNAKQDTLVSGTNIKTVNSTTLLGSGNLAVQEVLVSGTNIKTVNGSSLLGSGNLVFPHPSYVYQMTGTSFDPQVPSGLDTALRVEFGSSQAVPNVDLDSTGQVTFLTAGDYIINAFGDVTRTGSAGSVVYLAWRALVNGTQFGEAKVFMIDDPDTNNPYEITIPFTAAVNDRLSFEIMRDSSGTNDGGLYPVALTGGWGETPSAQIQIWKNE